MSIPDPFSPCPNGPGNAWGAPLDPLPARLMLCFFAILVERTGTEDIRQMGGMALRAPVLAALFLIVALATLAMPGSANFIGEFYILNGLFQAAKRKARGYTRFATMRTVIFLIAGKLDFSRLNPQAA